MIEGRCEFVGGTPASAPMFARLVSLLNEAWVKQNMTAMGFINFWRCKHANAFSDVALGDRGDPLKKLTVTALTSRMFGRVFVKDLARVPFLITD